jgi:hypothetical protein
MEVTHGAVVVGSRSPANPSRQSTIRKTGTRLASEMTNENGFAHALERPGGTHEIGGSKILQPP